MTDYQSGFEVAGYRIESVIGRGGMAVVYRAEDTRLGRKVALKVLTPVLAHNEQFQQRFIRESRLAASLDHPNIVPIYEAGEADGQLFIAMRYVAGSDLKALLGQTGGCPWRACSGSSCRSATPSTRRTSSGSCTATSSPATSWSPPPRSAPVTATSTTSTSPTSG